MSAELLADGSLNRIDANFIAQQCESFEGTWSASEDSITTIMDFGAGNESATMAYVLNGTTLTVTFESGSVETYTKVSTLLTCDDYGFGEPELWTGTFGALVDGSPMNFGNNAYVEEDNGVLGFGAYSGNSILAFVLDGGAAGSYTETNAAATYTPDFNNAYESFVATSEVVGTSLTLSLTASTATHIAGSFSFQASNISAPAETVTVTGQFDLTHP